MKTQMNTSAWFKKFKVKKIGPALTVYLGSAWVLREGFRFIVEKYNWTIWISDSLTILVIFGLPALLIYLWYNEEFTKKTVLYQLINLVIAFSLIGYNLISPGNLESLPSQIMYSKDGKKELAESINSLVVLPFDNYTGNDSLEYFVSGMHNALIGDIGKLSALRVPGTTTSKAYKKVEMSIPEIVSELGVDAAIEGSVTCITGDSICLQIKLVSAFPNEQQIWVKNYYEEKSKILNLYHKVTKQISDEINIVLTPQEESLLAESKLVNPEAYDAFLKGQYYWEKLDRESMQKALGYFELAIEIDPEWADPYAGLANAWSMFGTFFRTLPKSESQPKFYKYMNKALDLNPNSAHAHYVKALNAVWAEFDWKKGEVAFLRSIELNPNDALCRMYYAHLLMILRRLDEAVDQANLALQMDPLKPLILGLYGVVISERNEQSATEHFEKALSIDPNFGFARGNLAKMKMKAAYRNEDYEKWIEMWDKKVGTFGNWNDEGRTAVLNAFHEKGHVAAIEEMFKMNKKYGNNCYMSASIKAERNLKLKKYDKVIDYLEEEFEKRDMGIAYITTNYYLFDQLKDNPRYRELLMKMNLPFKK